ncbi:MAG TPA: ATP-binding protein, partial [Flavisolibacter sp.]|nr:ATP-binding protein [Flavisolibacter sp.]
RKFRGAWILFSSIALCLLFLAVLIKINIEKQPDLITTVVALIFLSSASGIVIFLAIDFARTSNSLKSRVAEVESLSHKTLEQEREKQQILANQKEQLEMEVQHRTSELRKSLTDLKATQRQLIQSEKMASLGELTSGIAHELQNPLNFINNFSDVNSELIAELRNEINKGNMESAFTILEDIKENEQKVNLHGKRADIIVKNMMQHSRPSSGIKEPADINALAEDFMQLSYHNIRSKDKNFFARLEMDLDENMGSIYIIPQDIGRVMLNLYNNAFYAVNEKKKHTANSFEPTVSVCTKRFDNKIQVTVKDNGIGIPEKMINKIYQPFFTTKPTGQGTGLGLSISYNIIKAHGGELIVQSKEGEGSTFTFELNTN